MIKYRDFSGGLWVMGAKDKIPANCVRRGRGLHALKTLSARTRNGLAQIADLNAHSIFRYNDGWVYGVSTQLYQGSTSRKTGLNGNRLSFCPMPPSAGMADYLFVSGGGSLFKMDSAGNVTNWGIDAPDTSAMSASANSVGEKSIDDMEDNGGGDTCDARWQDANLVDGSGETATQTEETTRVQEGSSSLKLAVAADGIDAVIYDYYTANGNTELDLTKDDDGNDSLDTDFISFWVRMARPERVDFIQIDFSVGVSDFSGVVYSRRFVPDEDADTSGIYKSPGDLTEYTTKESERKWVEYVTEGRSGKAKGGGTGPVRVKRLEQRTITEKFCALALAEQKDIWQRLKIAKNVFDKRGDAGGSAYNWSNVRAIRLSVKNGHSTSGTSVWFDDIKLEGGTGLQGTYQYAVTFRNSTTGNRSNAGSTIVMVEDLVKQSVSLTGIPTSSDSQVDQREIWRTIGGGTLFWLCDRIDDNTTTTYTDTVADPDQDFDPDHDVLDCSVELPTDNAEPYSTFDDCAFHLGAAFWIDRTTSGRKGNVYYSPTGRVEAMKGFIRVTNDDDPLQKLVKWNDALYVFSESSIFRIDGSYPYTARKVYGCPGTDKPHTISVSLKGVLYEGDLGVRLFNGMSSVLANMEAISGIFQGESHEQLTAFSGTVAAAGKDRYYISDGSQTLVLDLTSMIWRDLGIGLSALFYAPDSKQFLGTYSSKVCEIEQEGSLTDAGAFSISFVLEPGHTRLSPEGDRLVDLIHIDTDTDNQLISCYLLYDNKHGSDNVKLLDSWTEPSRYRRSIPVGIYARVIGIRLTGSFSRQIEVFGIDIELNGEGGKS